MRVSCGAFRLLMAARARGPRRAHRPGRPPLPALRRRRDSPKEQDQPSGGEASATGCTMASSDRGRGARRLSDVTLWGRCPGGTRGTNRASWVGPWLGAGQGAGLARRASKSNLECAGPEGERRSGASVWRWGSGCLGITSQWGFSGKTWIPDVRRWTCLPGTFLCNPPPRSGSRVLILKSKLQMMGLCKMMGLG